MAHRLRACEDVVSVQGQVALFFDDAVAAGVEINPSGRHGRRRAGAACRHGGRSRVACQRRNNSAGIELVTLNNLKFVGWKVGYALGALHEARPKIATWQGRRYLSVSTGKDVYHRLNILKSKR